MGEPRAASMVVVFANATSNRTPTFHRWGDHRFSVVEIDQGEEVRSSTFKTACGLVMDHTRWVERYHSSRRMPVHIEEEHNRWVGLRFDNASLIGKPCGHCYRPSRSGATPDEAGPDSQESATGRTGDVS